MTYQPDAAREPTGAGAMVRYSLVRRPGDGRGPERSLLLRKPGGCTFPPTKL